MGTTHQLKETDGKTVTAKCGKVFNKKNKQDERATVWWHEITCEGCLPKLRVISDEEIEW